MSFKTILVLSCVGLTFTIFALTKTKSGELELPECNLDNTVKATTQITILVDEDVLQKQSLESVKASLQSSVNYANQVLSNSCVPLTRSIEEVQVITLDKDKIESVDHVKQQVQTILEKQGVVTRDLKPGEKYGLIIENQWAYYAGLSGRAEALFGAWFFILSSDAPVETFEHEMGHLAWAQHSEHYPTPNLSLYLKSITPQEYHGNLMPFARAAKCGNAGTIMSYERNVLPIYSSPDIRYQGEVCGDRETADNARVLRNFALSLME